jgi:UDP-2,4-diacetamido-2,4,6-trideoxy-beta-L-altropyranose hydrolase
MSQAALDHVTGGSLLVRTDASPAIGMGHAMRCLSLAEAHAEAGGQTTFLMAQPPSGFAERVRGGGAQVRPLSAAPATAEDLEQTLAVADRMGATWIVLDGYQFDADFQAGLVAAGKRVLAVDDHGHARRYSSELVLNHNAGADQGLYRVRRPDTRLLLGPRFALMREEFRRWPAPRRPPPPRARRVVVTFGGSDPDNVSGRVLEALASVDGPLDVELIIGPSNLNRGALEADAASCPHPVEVLVDVREMAARLARADLAVAAAGVTALELARVGTPHVAIPIADNQLPGALALGRDGIVVNLGWHADVSGAAIADAVTALADNPGWRAALSRRGQELVDGCGAYRVLAAMGLMARAAPL